MRQDPQNVNKKVMLTSHVYRTGAILKISPSYWTRQVTSLTFTDDKAFFIFTSFKIFSNIYVTSLENLNYLIRKLI